MTEFFKNSSRIPRMERLRSLAASLIRSFFIGACKLRFILSQGGHSTATSLLFIYRSSATLIEFLSFSTRSSFLYLSLSLSLSLLTRDASLNVDKSAYARKSNFLEGIAMDRVCYRSTKMNISLIINVGCSLLREYR